MNNGDEQTIRDIIHEHEVKDFAFYDEIRTELKNSQGNLQRVQSDIKSFVLAGRILWAVGFLFLSSLGAVVGYLTAELGVVKERVQQVDTRQSAWEPFATKWGNTLDESIKRNDRASKERHDDQEDMIQDLQARVRRLEGNKNH